MLTQWQLTLRIAGTYRWVAPASNPSSSLHATRRVDCALEDPCLDRVVESRRLRCAGSPPGRRSPSSQHLSQGTRSFGKTAIPVLDALSA